MAVTRKTLVQNYNRELIGSYIDKYREIGQMYDSYENYAKIDPKLGRYPKYSGSTEDKLWDIRFYGRYAPE